MAVVNLTSESFDEEVLLSGKTVLVDFYADWCGPCRMVSPIVEEISEASRPDAPVFGEADEILPRSGQDTPAKPWTNPSCCAILTLDYA